MACKSFLGPLEGKEQPAGEAWLPYASQHPAMFFATLNNATMHVDAIAGSYWNPQNRKVLEQKSALMNQINACLQDSTIALTENTFSGVALLTITEVRSFELPYHYFANRLCSTPFMTHAWKYQISLKPVHEALRIFTTSCLILCIPFALFVPTSK